MKSVRLIFTENCNRRCAYCCNKQYDFSELEKLDWDKLSLVHTLVISGGEPMLFPDELVAFIERVKATWRPERKGEIKIILYTAQVEDITKVQRVLQLVDGLTLTLHDQFDVVNFEKLDRALIKSGPYNRSLRLSVFGDVSLPRRPLPLWDISQLVVLDNCPVPEDKMVVLQ